MKKILISFLAILSLVYSSSFVWAHDENNNDESRGKVETNLPGSVVDVHIGKEGKAMITGAKVVSVTAPVINVAVTWGSFVMNWAVKTDANTQIVRRFSGKADLSEVGVGDFLSVSGMLDTTAATPTILAKTIRDYSIQKKNVSFGGVIKSIDSASSSFMLTTEKKGDVKVTVSSSTKITKADVIIALADLKVGDKILVARGVLNTVSNTLQANEIRVFALKIDANKTSFEGVVKSVAGSTLPTTMVVTLHGNIDFTVSIPANISILNKMNTLIPVASIAAGDNIQIFGSANTVATTINATLIRDLSR